MKMMGRVIRKKTKKNMKGILNQVKRNGFSFLAHSRTPYMNQKPGMAFWFIIKLTMAEVGRMMHRKTEKTLGMVRARGGRIELREIQELGEAKFD